ncbi:MAG: leucine--tRNA ligase, partial [Candidatus Pacebacteria bacterium]|nr:leucine--tRNA ligase [Candidatus Paceibacterota bacterium]
TSTKPKCYVLDMFPYPSGEGLHVGHPKGYIATDVYSRFQKMSGKEVLHPMGWDAFGLPAENYAIKNKIHPRVAVEKNIARYKEQLESIGFNYDWSREVNTTDPDFYKWTQWIFLKLYEKGLAFESHEPINWCPSCQTGLANEDLEDGKCERCGSVVEKRPMRQWVLRITDYAERLLADLDTLTGWPEHIKESQRNWIGKSEGAVIKFQIPNAKLQTSSNNQNPNEESVIEVFTTRPDTLYGATYVVLAPEHKLIPELAESASNTSEIFAYVQESKNKPEIERSAEGREKTGVKIEGVMAINPATQEEIPVCIADYVLGSYGTGAVMAVPAHDDRDWEFAKKYDLPIKPVVVSELSIGRTENSLTWQNITKENYSTFSHYSSDDLRPAVVKYLNNRGANEWPGILIDSGNFSGRYSEDAKGEITDSVGGRWVTKYKLRDWVFSRQRYWGEPIPLVHCEKDGVVPVPEDQLPVTLPDVEHYEPTGTGESPLAAISDWVNTTCPQCGGPAKRETNTMPQWAGSSWYYLRYIDPKNNNVLVDKEKEAYWSPVDMYVGGAEHATRHLIYARFWHKFLYDIGAVSHIEPFMRLKSVGLILAEDGRKMSKRYGNVINPDDIVSQFGADSLRIYEMFMGPFEQAIAWSTDGLVGARRFTERVARLKEKVDSQRASHAPHLETLMHQTIKKVTEDIGSFRMNTAISALMIYSNALEKEGTIPQEAYETLLTLLAPFAVFLTEELWEGLGREGSIHSASWPVFDPEKTVDGEVVIAIQVNGKVRGTITCPRDTDEATVLALARGEENVEKWLNGKDIAKIVYIDNKVLNLVVKEG